MSSKVFNSRASKFWERTDGVARLPHPIVVEYPGNRLRERKFDSTPAAPVRTPFDLPANYYQCVHVETVVNQAEGTVDYVRCDRDSEKGFLCGEHDHRVLDRKVRGQNTPFNILKEAQPEHIIANEKRALAEVEREVCGIGKSTFECVKDYTLHGFLDNLLGQLFLDDYEFGIVDEWEEVPFLDEDDQPF